MNYEKEQGQCLEPCLTAQRTEPALAPPFGVAKYNSAFRRTFLAHPAAWTHNYASALTVSPVSAHTHPQNNTQGSAIPTLYSTIPEQQ